MTRTPEDPRSIAEGEPAGASCRQALILSAGCLALLLALATRGVDERHRPVFLSLLSMFIPVLVIWAWHAFASARAPVRRTIAETALTGGHMLAYGGLTAGMGLVWWISGPPAEQAVGLGLVLPLCAVVVLRVAGWRREADVPCVPVAAGPPLLVARETVAPSVGSGATCPYCREEVASGQEEVVACGDCATLHHRSCFEEHGRCTVLGCGGRTARRERSAG